MKNNRRLIYIILAVVVAVLLFLLLYKPSFNWTPTFKSNDPEPYGCMVFDSVMSASMPGRYVVSDSLPESIMDKSENQRKTLLFLYSIAQIDPQPVLKYAKQGGHVIIAAEMMHNDLAQGLDRDLSLFDYSTFSMDGSVPVEGEYSTVRYHKSKQFKAESYKLSKVLVSSCIEKYDYLQNLVWDNPKAKQKHPLKWKNVITAHENEPLMQTAKCGKGSISLVSMPLLFTNYGILEGENHRLIMRILTSAGGGHIIRTSAIRPENREEMENARNSYQSNYDESLLNEAFKSTALKTALYLAIAGLLLFLIFNSRRQQRIIPVIKKRENGQLEFIKQIGGFYRRNKANENIINKKYNMFTAKLQKVLHIDISDSEKTDENISIISQYTTIPKQEVQEIIHVIENYFHSRKSEEERIYNELKSNTSFSWMNDYYLSLEVKKRKSKTSKDQMIRLINYMNQIEHKL